MEYFVSRDSQVRGPFSKKQVLAAIKSKKLRKTDLLGTTSTGPWHTVEKVIDSNRAKDSDPPVPVQPEVPNDLGNAPTSDFDFASLPDLPAEGSLPAATPFVPHQPIPSQNPAVEATSVPSHLDQAIADLEKDEERNQKDEKDAASALKLQIIVGVLVVIVGVFGFFTAVRLSKPIKLKWAADSAFNELILSAAAYEALADKTDERSMKLKEKYEYKMTVAAAELDSILNQMAPDTREAWQESKIEQALEAGFESRFGF